MRQTYIDSDLFEAVRAGGNQTAVRELCSIAKDRLLQIMREQNCREDFVLGQLAHVLSQIAKGLSPDKAFGWAAPKRGRPKGNHTLRDWDVQRTVRELMRNGASREKACWAVSSEAEGEFFLGFDLIKIICSKVTADSELPMPTEKIFPIDPTRYRKLEGPAAPCADPVK